MGEVVKKYSIILPVRNGGEYAKQCIRSILAQTLPDSDLVVLDNACTDGTLAWIQALNDDRIRCYPSNAALTIEANWNRALDVQKNEFMTLIGHDDLLHPDYLQQMDALVAQHPRASLYQAHFLFIDEHGQTIRACQPMAEVQSAAEFLECECLNTLDSMGTGYLMRSKDFDRLGGMTMDYPKLIFADCALWIKLILVSYKATTTNMLFYYRHHNNTSRLTNGEDYQTAFMRYGHFLSSLRDPFPDIAHVLDRYGKRFLLYFCESLSHRLLKTARSERSTTVSQYIQHCRALAKKLIPGQAFLPMLRPRIFAAALLDNQAGVKLFITVRKRFVK